MLRRSDGMDDAFGLLVRLGPQRRAALATAVDVMLARFGEAAGRSVAHFALAPA